MSTLLISILLISWNDNKYGRRAGKSNYLNFNIRIFAAKLNNDPLLNLARRDATRRPFARRNLIKCSHTFATLFYRFIELLN